MNRYWETPENKKKMEILSSNIKFLCNKEGVTLYRLCKICGISYPRMYSYLKCKSVMPYLILVEIAKVFNVKVEYLTGD